MSELFLRLVNMSISASWLVLAVLVLRLVLKKAPKWVSVLLWAFVAVRLVCPFSVESIFSLIPSAQTVSPDIMMEANPQIHTGISALNSAINPIVTQSFAPAPGVSMNPLQLWIPLAAFIWLAGMVCMLSYTAVSYLLLRRKVATAVRLEGNLYQSEQVDSPFVLGLVRPKIYLPFRLEGEDMAHVIAHEQAHIRRKDHWWKPVGFLLLALHWFNPLLWLAYVLLCRDIELACDEKVIGKMDSSTKADYSQALLNCSARRRSIAACPLAFGEVGVKQRIWSVMHYKKPAFWLVMVAVAACVAVGVCFLTDPVSDKETLREDRYYLQIEADGIYEIAISMPGTSGGCVNADGSAFKKGETVWLEQLDGVEEIRGLRIRALDEAGTEKYHFAVPEDATEAQIRSLLEADSWLTVPVRKDREIAQTFNGSIKTYHQNTDGTWQADGQTYLYRLEITGRMHDAVQDSTFVYLSNLKTIPFERAWKAAGFSSNTDDYFAPEEAVPVDWLHGDISQTGGADASGVSTDPPVIADGKLFFDDAVTEAILERNAGAHFAPDGLIQTQSHRVLGVISKSGTPLASKTDHMEEVTLYIQYVYNRYGVSEGKPERVAGICTPAVLTFSCDEEAEYTLKDFWEPVGGEQYAQSIRSKFPEDIADILLSSDHTAAEELEAECLKKAEEYLASVTN